MEQKVKDMLEKAVTSAEIIADKTGKAAVKAADKMRDHTSGVVERTKLGLRLVDVQSSIELLYKEVGRMVYDAHNGIEIDREELEARLCLIDEKEELLQQLRAQVAESKEGSLCPVCGETCSKEDAFCKKCGAPLNPVLEEAE